MRRVREEYAMPSFNELPRYKSLERHDSAPVFRILIVDDNAADANLIAELMKNIQRPHEEYIVRNGLEALEFLKRRAEYVHAPRPDLVLLDINMPGLTGIEVLSAIKSDAELSVIPVIMLSTSNSPAEVRRCYESHANVYVRKPSDLATSDRLIRAIEAFWMSFAVLPSFEQAAASSYSNGHHNGHGAGAGLT